MRWALLERYDSIQLSAEPEIPKSKKEKDHAHLSRTESDQLPLFQLILKQRKDCWLVERF